MPNVLCRENLSVPRGERKDAAAAEEYENLILSKCYGLLRLKAAKVKAASRMARCCKSWQKQLTDKHIWIGALSFRNNAPALVT